MLGLGVNHVFNCSLVLLLPDCPDATRNILSILIERGMRLDETFCDTAIRHSCTPEQRSNLMDLALKIDNPKLIGFFEKKGLKPHAN